MSMALPSSAATAWSQEPSALKNRPCTLAEPPLAVRSPASLRIDSLSPGRRAAVSDSNVETDQASGMPYLPSYRPSECERAPAVSVEPAHDQLPLLECPSLASGTTYPAPFVASELQTLEDPLLVESSTPIGVNTMLRAESLPDDGLDSQAKLLHYMVEAIREEGFTAIYCFKGRSRQELREFLQRDPAFSNAFRDVFKPDLGGRIRALLLIIRHICRRPPSYRPRKSVSFAPEPQIFEDNQIYNDDGVLFNEPTPPFVAEQLRRLPDAVESADIMAFGYNVYFKLSRLTPEGTDRDVQAVRIMCDNLAKLGVTQHLLAGLDDTGLRSLLDADGALREMVQAILQLVTPALAEQLLLFMRYLCLPLLL